MKHTKQRLREIIKEELESTLLEVTPKKGTPEYAAALERFKRAIHGSPKTTVADSKPPPDSLDLKSLHPELLSISQQLDALQSKVQRAAFRNLEQHPQVKEALTALQEAKIILDRINK